mmetsp:Transcript_39298/g.58780  ORF Transcript_39298/g.58780 Transcript_39298/m.58780 type:complete len:228 (+) Transcript_39298:106-789(+)
MVVSITGFEPEFHRARQTGSVLHRFTGLAWHFFSWTIAWTKSFATPFFDCISNIYLRRSGSFLLNSQHPEQAPLPNDNDDDEDAQEAEWEKVGDEQSEGSWKAQTPKAQSHGDADVDVLDLFCEEEVQDPSRARRPPRDSAKLEAMRAAEAVRHRRELADRTQQLQAFEDGIDGADEFIVLERVTEEEEERRYFQNMGGDLFGGLESPALEVNPRSRPFPVVGYDES